MITEMRKNYNPFKNVDMVDKLYDKIINIGWFDKFGVTLYKDPNNVYNVDQCSKIINDQYHTISNRNHKNYNPMVMNINSPHFIDVNNRYIVVDRYEQNYNDCLMYKIFDGLRPSFSMMLDFHDHNRHFIDVIDIVHIMNQFMKDLYPMIKGIMISNMKEMYSTTIDNNLSIHMYKVHQNNSMFDISYYPFYNIPIQFLWNSNYSNVITIVVSPILKKVGIIGYCRDLFKKGNINTIKLLSEDGVIVSDTHIIAKSYYNSRGPEVKICMFQKMLSYDGSDEDCISKINNVIEWYSILLTEQNIYFKHCKNLNDYVGLYQYHYHVNNSDISHGVEVIVSNVFNYLCANVIANGVYDTSFIFNEAGNMIKRSNKIQNINVMKRSIDESSIVKDGKNELDQYDDRNSIMQVKIDYYQELHNDHISFIKSDINSILEPVVCNSIIECRTKHNTIALPLKPNAVIDYDVEIESLTKVRSVVIGLSLRCAEDLKKYRNSSQLRFKLHNYTDGSDVLTKEWAISSLKESTVMLTDEDKMVSWNGFARFIYENRDNILTKHNRKEDDYVFKVYHSLREYNEGFTNKVLKPIYTYDSIIEVIDLYKIAATNTILLIMKAFVDNTDNILDRMIDAYHSYKVHIYQKNNKLDGLYKRFISLSKERKNFIEDKVHNRRIDCINNLKIEDMNKELIIQFNYYCESSVGYIDLD